jgi:hypothetical protein
MTSVIWPVPVVFPFSKKTRTSVEHLHLFNASPLSPLRIATGNNVLPPLRRSSIIKG